MTSRLLVTGVAVALAATLTTTARAADNAGHAHVQLQPHYPQLDAPLNPVPRPNIPSATIFQNMLGPSTPR